jgi:hypothetical protein
VTGLRFARGERFVGDTEMNLLSSWLPEIKSEQFFSGISLIALVGAGKFLLEYSRDNRRKRMEMYVHLRQKFRENTLFDPISAALDEYGGAKDEVTKAAARTKLSAIPYGDRYEFVALA